MISTTLSIPATTLNVATPTPNDIMSVEILLKKDPSANTRNVILTVDGVEYTIDIDDYKESARKLDIVLA